MVLALAVVVLTAVTSPAVAAQASVAESESPDRLHPEGRWLVDGKGRTVLLHGVNVVYKKAPWIPPDGPQGFSAADADLLADSGFNVVRLGVLFAGAMPEPGEIDTGYLDQVDRVVRLLAQRRIYVLLDFHQDMFTQWPEWAQPWNTALPDDRNYGFPGNYFLSTYLNAAYDNLWADTNGVWRHYRHFARAVAERFADQDHVLGYDLMNEPWPGTHWPLCLTLGCAQRDAAIQRFQENAAAGIREADREGIVWFEPNPLSLYVQPSHLGDTPVADQRIGFTWHTYCGTSELTGSGGPDCAPAEQRGVANGVENGRKLGAALLLGEFGNTDDPQRLNELTALADEHLISWAFWAYKGFDDPPGQSSMFTDETDLSTLKPEKADALIRPFPRAVAGTPMSLSFDPATKTFHLSYRPNSRARTEISVPTRHYPDGYRVTVQGGKATSKPGATILTTVADRDATQVDITLTPLSIRSSP